MATTLFHAEKHPADRRQLVFGFAAYLSTGETITGKTVTVPADLGEDAGTIDDSDVSVWVEGGTAGTRYRVVCTITTSTGAVETMECDLRVIQP